MLTQYIVPQKVLILLTFIALKSGLKQA